MKEKILAMVPNGGGVWAFKGSLEAAITKMVLEELGLMVVEYPDSEDPSYNLYRIEERN